MGLRSKLIQTMKTALLGLLEVLVVRANGGDAAPDPPSVGDVTYNDDD